MSHFCSQRFYLGTGLGQRSQEPPAPSTAMAPWLWRSSSPVKQVKCHVLFLLPPADVCAGQKGDITNPRLLNSNFCCQALIHKDKQQRKECPSGGRRRSGQMECQSEALTSPWCCSVLPCVSHVPPGARYSWATSASFEFLFSDGASIHILLISVIEKVSGHHPL